MMFSNYILKNWLVVIKHIQVKTLSYLCNHVKILYLQVRDFNQVRFIWALRSMFVTVISLIIAYFYPNTALWLISSSVIALQLYAYAGKVFKKNTIFVWTILLVLCCTAAALISSKIWVLWSMIFSATFFTFYFSHRSNEHAVLGLWSIVLVIINAFFPINISQFTERIGLLFIGIMIAYFMVSKNKIETISLPTNNTVSKIAKKEYLKYALKGGIAALLALFTAYILDIQQGYWVLFGAIAVTKLHVEASLRRVKERMYGTLLGVAISLLLALCLLHWPLGIAIIIPLCVFGAVYYFPYYAIAVIFITILFVLTFGVISQQPITYGLARIVDTSIGVALALMISFFLWPYKEKN